MHAGSVNYGPKDYVERRGDLIDEVDFAAARVKRTLWGK